jgi:hypothetical protein
MNRIDGKNEPVESQIITHGGKPRATHHCQHSFIPLTFT